MWKHQFYQEEAQQKIVPADLDNIRKDHEIKTDNNEISGDLKTFLDNQSSKAALVECRTKTENMEMGQWTTVSTLDFNLKKKKKLDKS